MNLHTTSREDLLSKPPPGPLALVTFRDPGLPPSELPPGADLRARLDIVCHDIDEPMAGLVCFSPGQASRLLTFVQANAAIPTMVFQCEAGVGRSRGAQIAIAMMYGTDPYIMLEKGTHNRLVVRLLIQAAGGMPTPEPLVSMAVRVKYPADRLLAFLLCMQRQRHKNWECVAVTDGPRPDALEVVKYLDDPRVRLIQTGEAKGRWGHPIRQQALDECRGEFIGTSNEDNWYNAVYFELMVLGLQRHKADLAMCDLLHSYMGYGALSVSPDPNWNDLGCWIARAPLVRRHPWPGTDFHADARHIAAMAADVGHDRIVYVRRPLFIHN